MKTYLDSGVLIAAFQASGTVGRRAIEILDDSNREFASSNFVRLEVLPKAVHNRQPQEAQFYEAFFNSVQFWASDLEKLVERAYQVACQHGLAALDALHVAAALSVGAEELITTERPNKPMHRVSGIRVVSILD